MLPEEENEVRHKEFYHAIRSEDPGLLDTLINKWSDLGTFQLDEMLSRAYDKLKLKNVPLSQEIKFVVENKLLDFRFFSNTSEGQERNINNDLYETEKRIQLILENIRLLTSDYPKSENVDERFLFITKFIAQNIHTLKRQLKSTYNILPWEEIEFSLVMFVSSCTKLQEINLFYRATLTKSKIIKYLELFAEHLEKVNIQGNKLHCLPRLKRDNVILNIIKSCSQFEDLYNDYQQVRDVCSLQKICDHINLALSTDPQEKEGQLIITKVLQVIGEHLKNTLESPKLSLTTSELLIQSLGKDVRDIIVALRDSISHAESLSMRIEIEKKANVDFFNIQKDLRKVGEAITVLLYEHKIKKVKLLLEAIANGDDFIEVREELNTFKLDEIMIAENFKITEHEEIEILVKKLSDTIEDKTDYEKRLFDEINEIIKFARNHSKNVVSDYVKGFINLRSLSVLLNDNKTNKNLLRVIKINANVALQNITSEVEPPGLKKIIERLLEICDSVRSRKRLDQFDIIKIKNFGTIWEIIYMLRFVTDRVKWIEELKKKLKNDLFVPKGNVRNSNANNITEEEYNEQLQLKLSDLKIILSKGLTLPCYNSDKKFQTAVEMLILDIMSILGISKSYLEKNALFIDDNAPLLHGTGLRNYLAHDNVVVDILTDSSLAIILNAKKIGIEENIIMKREKKIGKLIDDNPDKLRGKFHESLVTIMNQKTMFDVLKEGTLESFEDCLKKGADIKARSINLWTTLHFAAMGSSLKVIQFILDRNISVDVKDSDGQTSLHVAAAHGRTNIVDFFIKEMGVNVDEVDNRDRTPLHVASQNGHAETVEVLIKHRANAVAQDRSGFPPLHYAIRNNHIAIVKILLKMYFSDDINKTIGGLAPLNEAAENGNLHIVRILLAHGADVNCIKHDGVLSPFTGHLQEEDRVTYYGFTPLHGAAENGHDQIANILLEYGACVYAIDKSSTTPLHYAASNGHVRVANLLLKNNANVNATTVRGRTPLHMAVWNGHMEIAAILIAHGADIHAQDVNKDTPLHDAAAGGHRDIAELLLNNGSEINAKCNKNLTPLHVTAGHGHEDVTDLLITKNADVDARDVVGSTPLIIAATRGNTNIINLLIKNHAEVNIRAVNGRTPLHIAALSNHIEAVDFLIKSNAEVNVTDNNYGWTPLHFAVHEGNGDIVNLLIDNGAQIDTADNSGFPPLLIAAITDKTNIIDLLIKRTADVNIRDINGNTPLHAATAHRHMQAIEVLIKNRAEVNAADNSGWTPLHLAALERQGDVVKFLLNNKAQADATENDGCSALYIAAMNGNTNVMELLIKKNAEVNLREVHGRTPLHTASQRGHMEAVDFLIKNQAEVNATENNGWTPLHFAAQEGHENIVNYLIDSGAQVDTAANDGKSPLHIVAAKKSVTNIIRLLIKRNAEINSRDSNASTPLHLATVYINMEAIDYLIKNNAEINAADNFGSTPLHFAAHGGHGDIVNLFLDSGAQVDTPACDGRSPLHMAAMKGKTNIVDFLIKRNADVNIKDDYGDTPLHVATARNHMEVGGFLIKRNAEVNATNSAGWTPLHFAAQEGNVDMINLLIDSGAQVNAAACDGKSPLHIAAITGSTTVLELLMKRNAEVNIIDVYGNTPLSIAIAQNHVEAIDFLIKETMFRAIL